MHVFNIPSSEPFLRTLVDALLDGRLVAGYAPRRQPETLADATLYLPTRRAGRLVRDAFLDALGTQAAILPRIVALGDTDEEELAFADLPDLSPDSDAALTIPPALDGLPRRMMLAQMIAAWAARIVPDDPDQAPLVVAGPASTLALADDLARLMDDMVTRGVPWTALHGLVPDAVDRYWQITLRFLEIATTVWPDALAERGRIEPAARRDLMIAAEAARLAASPRGPVIAAGSTGSMPSTAKLLHAIAMLPHGAVVLPGLDMHLDADAWDGIGGARADDGRWIAQPASNHPQYALHGLLARFGMTRNEVVTLGRADETGRGLLASETMRPASASAQWQARLDDRDVAAALDAAMTDIAIVAARSAEMEALTIAVAMREAHEKDLTCALVTPDRALARRVLAALGRWSLVADDSGGDPLPETPAGIFARLAARVALSGCEPPDVLALLKHPLFRLGRPAHGWRRAIETLERAVYRGTRPAPGCAALIAAIEAVRIADLHGADARGGLAEDEYEDALQLLAGLRDALAPLESVTRGKRDFADLVARHRAVVDALARDDTQTIAAYDGAMGQSLERAFDEVAALGGPSGLGVPPHDYADVFQTAFADLTVRRPPRADAKLRILGPLEARLIHVDRVIMGGLIESVWPPAPRIDPWLSRPMRHDLGLDLPERRIGLSAHDFAQMLGARDVILTHATKSGGAPAVASRFLHRLEAVVGRVRWTEAAKRGAFYLACAKSLDAPATVTPVHRPEPKPPLSARPLRLPVTDIEHLYRDPYTIFARRILKLRPLDPVDMPASPADRGNAIHRVIGDFTVQFGKTLPADIHHALRTIGETHFAPLMSRPEAKALWWPRFLRIAQWLAVWETERRDEAVEVLGERDGKLDLPLSDGRIFTLTARADRIERRRDRTFAILDFKTGQTPSDKQVRLGLSPQLTLETAILREGGFAGIAKGSSVSEIAYVRLSGNDPLGETKILPLKLEKDDALSPDEGGDEARAKLVSHLMLYETETQGYPSIVMAQFANRYGTYDDLARIAEWSIAGSDEGDEA